MNVLTKASPVNTALQVIQHMNNGMTVVEACVAKGMPPNSFSYIIGNNLEAIAEVQVIIEVHILQKIGLIPA